MDEFLAIGQKYCISSIILGRPTEAVKRRAVLLERIKRFANAMVGTDVFSVLTVVFDQRELQTLISMRWVDYGPTVESRHQQYRTWADRTDAGQVFVSNGSATAWIKVDHEVEEIQLFGNTNPRVVALESGCMIAAVRVLKPQPGREVGHYEMMKLSVVCNEVPNVESAATYLSTFLSRTGIRDAVLDIQTNWMFAAHAGPKFDLFRVGPSTLDFHYPPKHLQCIAELNHIARTGSQVSCSVKKEE